MVRRHGEKGGSNNDLARKYGKSGINMMGVFSTTGEAPINEGEILEAFNRMDTNKDDVISKDEFSEAPEVSKLPAGISRGIVRYDRP